LNGQKVDSPGVKIDKTRDTLVVDGKKVDFSGQKDHIYLAFNKPVQVVTTADDPEGRATIFDVLPPWVKQKRLFSVGRLDYFSEGLLLLTNDGDLAHRLTHPSWHSPKRYRVLLREKPSTEALGAMRKGMTLTEGETLAPIKVLSCQECAAPKGFILEIELIQGLNRQIRRMCRDLGLTVLKLARVSQGPVSLGDLAPGKFRDLRPDEVAALRQGVGLGKEDAPKRKAKTKPRRNV